MTRPSEYRRKKRIKDLKICGWFLVGLPAGGGEKVQEELHDLIGIEKPEFLPGFPKLRIESVSFRGIKMDFRFVEKA